jgi:hypothetical protein
LVVTVVLLLSLGVVLLLFLFLLFAVAINHAAVVIDNAVVLTSRSLSSIS